MGRFVLVGYDAGAFAIQDTEDTSTGIEILNSTEIKSAMLLGIQIDGVSLTSDGSVFYSPEHFYADESAEAETEEAYEDEEIEQEEYEDEEYEEEYEEEEIEQEEYEEDEEEEEYEEDVEEDVEEVIEEDDYEEEEYDEYDEEVDVNKSSFHILSEALKDQPEILGVLLSFYTLYSRMVVKNGTLDPTLHRKNVRDVSEAKQAKLDALAGNDVWKYAGFTDLGYDKYDRLYGHCSLGHALRYVHIAYNTSLLTQADLDKLCVIDPVTCEIYIDYDTINRLADENKIIKFGIDCLSDFFQISPEDRLALKSIQNLASEDMNMLAEIYMQGQGKVDEVKSKFGFFEETMDAMFTQNVINMLIHGGKTLFDMDKELYTFYQRFKKAGVIYPRLFVRLVREKLFGLPVLKYNPYKTIESEKIRKFLNENYFAENLTADKVEEDAFYKAVDDDVEGATLPRLLIHKAFVVDFMGYYRYNPSGDKSTDATSARVKYHLDDYPNNYMDGGNNQRTAEFVGALDRCMYRYNNYQDAIICCNSAFHLPVSRELILLIRNYYRSQNDILKLLSQLGLLNSSSLKYDVWSKVSTTKYTNDTVECVVLPDYEYSSADGVYTYVASDYYGKYDREYKSGSITDTKIFVEAVPKMGSLNTAEKLMLMHILLNGRYRSANVDYFYAVLSDHERFEETLNFGVFAFTVDDINNIKKGITVTKDEVVAFAEKIRGIIVELLSDRVEEVRKELLERARIAEERRLQKVEKERKLREEQKAKEEEKAKQRQAEIQQRVADKDTVVNNIAEELKKGTPLKDILENADGVELASVLYDLPDDNEYAVEITSKKSSKNGLPMKIAKTVIESGKKPSSKQMYHLQNGMNIFMRLYAKKNKIKIASAKTGEEKLKADKSLSKVSANLNIYTRKDNPDLFALVDKLYANMDAVINLTNISKEMILGYRDLIIEVHDNDKCTAKDIEELKWVSKLINVK